MAEKALVLETDWSSDIERILNDIRQNSVILSEFHNTKYFHLKSYLKYFRIPCIILSAFNSVFAVGLSSFMAQDLVSVINCIISLICGIIVSIELYMQIESSMREEVISCKNYYLLSVDIQKVLMLERTNRQVKGKVFLDKCFTEYCKLYENSGLLKKQIKDSLTPLEPELLQSSMSKPILAIENVKENNQIELTIPSHISNKIQTATNNVASNKNLEEYVEYSVPQIKVDFSESKQKEAEALEKAQESVVSNVNQLASSFGNLRNRFEKKANKVVNKTNNIVNETVTTVINTTEQVENNINDITNTKELDSNSNNVV